MSATTKVTTDHNEIREWVEGRGGQPAKLKSSSTAGDKPGVLRIDFPGYAGEGTLETVGWDDWFAVFDARELAFLYQEKTEDGHDSHFNKLVWRSDHAQTKRRA